MNILLTTPALFARVQKHRIPALQWALLFTYLVIVFGPLLYLGGQAIRDVSEQNNSLAMILPGARRLVLLAKSIGLASVVAISSLVAGSLAASLLWCWRSGLIGYLRWTPLILIVLPPYIQALVWSTVFQKLAALTGISLFQGWFASAWVQTAAWMPLATGLVLVGLETIDASLVNAARMLRPDLTSLLKIAIPLAAPLILAAGGFLFLLSLADYSVPALFQRSVYALEIFADYSASYRVGQTFLVALPLLLVSALIATYSQRGLASLAQTPDQTERLWKTGPSWPMPFACLQWGMLLFLGLQVCLPVVVLIGTSGNWADFSTAVSLARHEITYTFVIAILTASLCLPLAVAVALKLRGDQAGRKYWWLLVVLPLAIPAPLVGIGLIAVWNQELLGGIYGSLAMPILAGLARFTPFAVLLIYAQLRRIDPLLWDAARVLRPGNWRTWLQIRLPTLAPGLLAGACLVFALTVGELGATLIVVPPGRATLTLRIYNYLHYGASSVVSGLGLLMVTVSLLAGLLAVVALLSWSRLMPDTGDRS
ncbi:MAG: iron ABC transporter permease [Anaerolineales bacterium]|nr:iron ABC transporter permease [Anaerolineales bacterium]